ncbi:MAG: hypothetical protein ACR2IV_04085, partial [Bryobacteraceae bacterium]
MRSIKNLLHVTYSWRPLLRHADKNEAAGRRALRGGDDRWRENDTVAGHKEGSFVTHLRKMMLE